MLSQNRELLSSSWDDIQCTGTNVQYNGLHHFLSPKINKLIWCQEAAINIKADYFLLLQEN